jgi:hypothetical protein
MEVALRSVSSPLHLSAYPPDAEMRMWSIRPFLKDTMIDRLTPGMQNKMADGNRTNLELLSLADMADR